MNREQAGELAKVMQAYAEGKDVQYREFGSWCRVEHPSFDPFLQWRVKPEPKKTVGYRVYYMFNDHLGIYTMFAWEDSDSERLDVIENNPHFLKWKHTEWQYDILEEE